MRRYHYAASLATGAIAAGGTLGILIPPSVSLIIYGILTETDIGKLFIAGIVPGLIGILGYVAAVAVVTYRRPEIGPPGPRVDWRNRIRALGSVSGILILRSEEHTSELQSLMRISYAVFCLKKKSKNTVNNHRT